MKSKILYLTIIIMLIVIFTSNILASSTVAIVDFSNNTGYYLKGIEKTSSEILASLLANRNDFQVVEREKLKSIMTEQGFVESGMVNQEKSAVKIGQLLGAEYIVTGSLLNLDIEEKSFKGYGVETKKVILTLSCNIKAISVNSGAIEVGNIYTASESYQGFTSHEIEVNLDKGLA